jgi:hypothetical protein
MLSVAPALANIAGAAGAAVSAAFAVAESVLAFSLDEHAAIAATLTTSEHVAVLARDRTLVGMVPRTGEGL